MSRFKKPHKGRRPNQRFRQKRKPFNRARGRSRSFNPINLIQNTQPNHAPNETVQIQHAFNDFQVNNRIKTNIKQKGYLTPTPIQDKTIPHILNGKDVVGIANTGTGKTAAFLIPLIDKAFNSQDEKILIITPTRELAAQIQEELINLSRGLRIYSSLCIGGMGINRQIQQLRRNPQFVIGTPGRLKDLLERRVLNLSVFNSIVLDEVDRMLDMGFIRDIKHLISYFPEKRHSLFFSATIEGKVRQIMNQFLKNPEIISVKTGNITSNVLQDFVKFGKKNKIEVLHDLLIKDGFNKVLVFGRTKWSMEKLSKELIHRGFKAASIHGNKSQGQRRRALSQFKSGQVKVLLATDVAQRGLDIDNVTHVINYDLPETQDDYIHRIGRTGRADKKGVAITLIN